MPRTQWSVLLKWLCTKYFRPYVPLLGLTFACMLMASVFNAGSLAFIKPVLEVILIPEKAETAISENSTSDTLNESKEITPHKLRNPGKLDHLLRPLNQFIIEHSKGRPFGMLCVVAVLLVFVFLLKALFTFLQDYFMRYISEGVIRRLREDVYRHILELPLSHFTGTGTGKLMSFLNYDIVLCKDVVNVVFERAIFQPLQILALLGWAMFLNWQLTLASVVVIPVSGIVVSVVGKKLRRARFKSQQKLSDLNSILHETFSAVRIVRAFRMEDYERSRFESKTREIFRIAIKMARVRSAAGPAVEWLGALGVGLILLLGGYIVIIRKSMDGSDFMTYILALGMMYAPLKRLVKANSEFQEGLAGAERVHSLLHEEIPIRNDPSLPVLPPFEKGISYENVSFAYSANAEK
ncbi:MAG TPA: ABC transporter transmembrane domain-containing protein, partial [bacterium]|nr:ABC transporter transmembrane domain-containing protein [bacterium]